MWWCRVVRVCLCVCVCVCVGVCVCTSPDVCGRLLALLALCWMSAAVCSPPSYFGGCLRPFARSPRTFADVCGLSFVLASRCATLATSRPPRPSRGRADSIAETDHWLSNSCFEPQLQGVPSSAARFCGCLRPFAFPLGTSPDVCGRLPALVVLEQLNIATVATVGFAESGVPAGCLRPFARFGYVGTIEHSIGFA